jgi:hypothetical protein
LHGDQFDVRHGDEVAEVGGVVERMPVAYLDGGDANGHERPLRGRASSPEERFANKIGRMSPAGEVIGEYPIPAAATGPRAILALADGRLFFSAYDAGAIGEVIPRRGR